MTIKTISKEQAFLSIFNAFKWLIDNGLNNHKIEWLGEYPLLIINSPRDIFLTFQFLSHPHEEVDRKLIAFDPITHTTFLDNYESVKTLFKKEQFIAFAYLDAPYYSQYYERKFLLPQQEEIKKLFKEKYDSEDVIIIRSDNIYSNGDNSIKESITNLISARFFMLNGYMTLGDIGSGPDVIAFKINLMKELIKRGFIGKGTSISQLATLRVFGKPKENYIGDISDEEIVAIETESVSPKSGIKQLKKGYNNPQFSSMEFLDRKVLAVPFFNQRIEDIDVLTYDINNLEYRKCNKTLVISDFWRNKKIEYINQLHSTIKTMLLANLTFDETVSMISTNSLTMFQVLQKIQEIEVEKILDKVESII